jgi:hypothetical protein
MRASPPLGPTRNLGCISAYLNVAIRHVTRPLPARAWGPEGRLRSSARPLEPDAAQRPTDTSIMTTNMIAVTASMTRTSAESMSGFPFGWLIAHQHSARNTNL